MEDDAADELHPVRLHAQHPPGGLPAGGERLGQDVVQGLAVCKTLLEFRRLGLELLVRELGIHPVQGLDLVHQGQDGLHLLFRAGAEKLFQKSHGSFTFLISGPRVRAVIGVPG